MKVLLFVLASIFSVSDPGVLVIQDEQQCITTDNIVKPILTWNILSTKFIKNKSVVTIQILMHNPLNKQENFTDAKFIFSTDIASGISTSTHNLLSATFYNSKNIVIFNRIYEEQTMQSKHMVSKIKMQTTCFSREIQEVIQAKPIEIIGHIK
jgi:hypothetical protein